MPETEPDIERTTSQDDIRRFVSCITKKALSQGRAQELVREMHYRAYKCDYCEHWHVAKTPYTRQPKPNKKKRRDRRSRKRRG